MDIYITNIHIHTNDPHPHVHLPYCFHKPNPSMYHLLLQSSSLPIFFDSPISLLMTSLNYISSWLSPKPRTNFAPHQFASKNHQ